MAKLAYLLTWALSSHERESKRIDESPSHQVILLVDEIETHLHPRWQRTVLPSLMDALAAWRPENPPEVQIIATHSPLVLTSIEPRLNLASTLRKMRCGSLISLMVR